METERRAKVKMIAVVLAMVLLDIVVKVSRLPDFSLFERIFVICTWAVSLTLAPWFTTALAPKFRRLWGGMLAVGAVFFMMVICVTAIFRANSQMQFWWLAVLICAAGSYVFLFDREVRSYCAVRDIKPPQT